MHRFLVPFLALALTACGGDDGAEPHSDAGMSGVDSLAVDTLAAAPDTFYEEGADDDEAPPMASDEYAPPSRDEHAPPVDGAEPLSPIERDDTPGPPPLSARYRLAYVDGEALPVTIDENPDCRVELVHGDLWIRQDLSFDLQAGSRTTCGGEQISDDLRTAEGTVERSHDRLRFEATTGEFFATAVGTYTTNGHIEVDSLLFEAEASPVDWRFLR